MSASAGKGKGEAFDAAVSLDPFGAPRVTLEQEACEAVAAAQNKLAKAQAHVAGCVQGVAEAEAALAALTGD